MKDKDITDRQLMELLPPEFLSRYMNMRKEFDNEIEKIQGITRALSMLKNDQQQNQTVNSIAIGHICETLDQHATRASHLLDRHLPLAVVYDYLASHSRKR